MNDVREVLIGSILYLVGEFRNDKCIVSFDLDTKKWSQLLYSTGHDTDDISYLMVIIFHHQ